MIETIVIDYLENQTGIPSYGERPKRPDPEYLLVEKTGGGEEDLIRKATIAVQSYADSMARASKMNDIVEKTMKEITDLENISKCKLNSSYNYTDTESKKYRYQAVFNLTYTEGGNENE